MKFDFNSMRSGDYTEPT